MPTSKREATERNQAHRFGFQSIPLSVKLAAHLEAEEKALAAVGHLMRNITRVNFFWHKYQFEFRNIIERWIRINANL